VNLPRRTSFIEITLAALLLAGCGGSASLPATAAGSASAGSAPASAAAGKPAAASAGASGSVASFAAPAPSPSDQAAWDKLVAAAKQEGKLSLIVPPGDSYRKATDVFSQRYGVTVELVTGGGGQDLGPLVSKAYSGGQYLWDVIVHSPRVIFYYMAPVASMLPLRQELVLPEVTQSDKWIKGFDDGWADKNKSYDYIFVYQQDPAVYVNRKLAPESQLSTLEGLWDPQWKGKIAIQDPRLGSAGSNVMGTFMVGLGADKVRTLLTDQKPVITQDRRQLGDWLVRGTYPLAIGVDPPTLLDYQRSGVDLSSIQILDPNNKAAYQMSAGTGAIGVFEKAPHPNAAKLFANWLLSTEGQATWSRNTGYNSRRADVPVVSEKEKLDPNRQFINMQLEENYPTQIQATDIANEALK
jgi:ABC-type Fe3+ transport system substrate-binding protein